MIHLPMRVDRFVDLCGSDCLLTLAWRRLMSSVGSGLSYEGRRNIESPWCLHIISNRFSDCFLGRRSHCFRSCIVMSPGRDCALMISLFSLHTSILSECTKRPPSHTIPCRQLLLVYVLWSFSSELLSGLWFISLLILLDYFDLRGLDVDIINVVVIDDISDTLCSLLSCC